MQKSIIAILSLLLCACHGANRIGDSCWPSTGHRTADEAIDTLQHRLSTGCLDGWSPYIDRLHVNGAEPQARYFTIVHDIYTGEDPAVTAAAIDSALACADDPYVRARLLNLRDQDDKPAAQIIEESIEAANTFRQQRDTLNQTISLSRLACSCHNQATPSTTKR